METEIQQKQMHANNSLSETHIMENQTVDINMEIKKINNEIKILNQRLLDLHKLRFSQCIDSFLQKKDEYLKSGVSIPNEPYTVILPSGHIWNSQYFDSGIDGFKGFIQDYGSFTVLDPSYSGIYLNRLFESKYEDGSTYCYYNNMKMYRVSI